MQVVKMCQILIKLAMQFELLCYGRCCQMFPHVLSVLESVRFKRVIFLKKIALLLVILSRKGGGLCELW